MSDELLEFLGIAAGGIAIYLVAQNNAPAIKKAVSSIPAVSNIIPVSTRAPQDDRAPAPRGTCPPDYSPDYTMGVMHCHDSHGTRELNPNVKMFNPQWQNAWGDEGWASPPLIPTPSQTLAPPKPEPQTLREPSRIISSVNPQIKKSEEQRKRQEEKDKKVHTQVECPKDLSKMKCGSNCYKNGKLYKIVCSEAEREALYPPKKTKKKSITVPANFPGDVTISPGETPYPEVGDEPGGQDVPLTDLLPGQKQILPTIPSTTPGRGPTATTPPQIITPGAGKTIYPLVKRYPFSPPYTETGRNENITYASNHKKVVSHRVNFNNVPEASLEATVYLAWPSGCTGGGHPELAIKFWGPNHNDSSCCYCYTSAVPTKDGKNLDLGFGGEGPHPTTDTMQKKVMTIPLDHTKRYGIKGVIWKTSSGVHQETWYDDGSGWKKAGEYNRPSCGYKKTSTTPASNAQVEFRIDCSNITFSGTDLAVIRPQGGFAYAGPEGYIEYAPDGSIYEDEHLPY